MVDRMNRGPESRGALRCVGTGLLLGCWWLAQLLAGCRLAAAPVAGAAPDGRGFNAVARPLTTVERSLAGLGTEGSAGLFVGIGRFDANSGLSDLRFTPDDALALANLFVNELAILPATNTRVALGGQPRSQRGREQLAALTQLGVKVLGADRTALLDAVVEVAELASAENGLLVVSFSSHGFEEKGTAYVMPADGRRRLVASTGVSLQTVKDTLRDSRASKKLLFLDACRETIGSETRGEAKMPETLRQALAKAEGFGVLASCSVGQLSWESPELEQGVFTHFVIEALRGGAGGAVDGFIRVGQVSTYATQATRAWVLRNKKEVQEPWFEGEVAREIPLAFDSRVSARIEAERAANAALAQRRGRALDLLTEARKANREILPGKIEDDIAAAIQTERGAGLTELLEQVEDLADPKAARVRSFLAWWKNRTPANGLNGLVAAAPTNSPSRIRLEGLRIAPATNSGGLVPAPSSAPVPLTNSRVRMLLRGLDAGFCDKLGRILRERSKGFESLRGDPVKPGERIVPRYGPLAVAPTWPEWEGTVTFANTRRATVMELGTSRTYRIQFPADGDASGPGFETIVSSVRECLGTSYSERREAATKVNPLSVGFTDARGLLPAVFVRAYNDSIVISIVGSKP